MISPSPRTSKLTLGVSCQVPLKSHLLAADKLAARGGSTHRSEDGREPRTPVERRSHGPARRTRDPRPQPLVFPRSRLLVAGPAFFPDISGAPPSVSFAPSARAPLLLCLLSLWQWGHDCLVTEEDLRLRGVCAVPRSSPLGHRDSQLVHGE